MKKMSFLLVTYFLSTVLTKAQETSFLHQQSSGLFSLGTRNTFSLFNDHHHGTPGVGIGGQYRVQFSDRINTEWYLDWISSSIGNKVGRNDYHIGWSVMYYPGKNIHFTQTLQPYLIIGHCFDNSEMFEKKNRSNSASRLSMATQAGMGCHVNITPELDLSFSGQYMLHFGKEMEIEEVDNSIQFLPEDYSSVSGHLLLTVSANYKFGRLWR